MKNRYSVKLFNRIIQCVLQDSSATRMVLHLYFEEEDGDYAAEYMCLCVKCPYICTCVYVLNVHTYMCLCVVYLYM